MGTQRLTQALEVKGYCGLGSEFESRPPALLTSLGAQPRAHRQELPLEVVLSQRQAACSHGTLLKAGTPFPDQGEVGVGLEARSREPPPERLADGSGAAAGAQLTAVCSGTRPPLPDFQQGPRPPKVREDRRPSGLTLPRSLTRVLTSK